MLHIEHVTLPPPNDEPAPLLLCALVILALSALAWICVLAAARFGVSWLL